jgi:hypothetical protein
MPMQLQWLARLLAAAGPLPTTRWFHLPLRRSWPRAMFGGAPPPLKLLALVAATRVVVLAPATPPLTHLRVNAFAPYPPGSGAGIPLVQGTVTIKGAGIGLGLGADGDDRSQTITWDFQGGLDRGCTQALTTGTSNVCGIHIHQGKSCTDPSTVGGHLWGGPQGPQTGADPWKKVQYNFRGDTQGADGSEAVITNLTLEELNNHVLIVHNSVDPGARVACGVVRSATSGPAGDDALGDGEDSSTLLVLGLSVLGIVCVYLCWRSTWVQKRVGMWKLRKHTKKGPDLYSDSEADMTAADADIVRTASSVARNDRNSKAELLNPRP